MLEFAHLCLIWNVTTDFVSNAQRVEYIVQSSCVGPVVNKMKVKLRFDQ